jgi:hypothetical protein
MDPNANLLEQKQIARRLANGDYGDDTAEDLGARLAELVLALNMWISRGGFLPEDWQHDDPAPEPMAKKAEVVNPLIGIQCCDPLIDARIGASIDIIRCAQSDPAHVEPDVQLAGDVMRPESVKLLAFALRVAAERWNELLCDDGVKALLDSFPTPMANTLRTQIADAEALAERIDAADSILIVK